MSSVFQHPWLGGLFADPEMAALWSPQAQLEAMRAFEIAWSRALGDAGIVSSDLAQNAADAIGAMTFDLNGLRAGTASDGVVIPQFVAQMQAAAPGAKAAIHKGATSQDVIDTATAFAMAKSLDLLEARLIALHAALQAVSAAQGAAPLMGRTRMQAATEITVADRMAPWILPLAAHISRISEVRPRVAVLQFGGASGDRRATGDKSDQIAAFVAAELGLGNPPRAWHAMRDGIAEFASLLSLISGTLGKMGQDMALMAQQGISEIALAGGGASSAMPHKQNPVLAELLITLARYNAGALAQIHQSLVHEQERSGAAWALEWMVLPQMAETTGRALSVAQQLTSQIRRIGTA